MKTNNRQQEILEAANHVVLAQGAAHLTLDAVAQMAGVSKGGLLYHFPNKESLIAGMLELYLDDFERRIEAALSTLPDGEPGGWLKAYVLASFDEQLENPSLIAGVIAAVVDNPALLTRVRLRYTDWLNRSIASGVSRQTAVLVLQSTDGLWYAEWLGINLLDAEDRLGLRNRLLQLIEDES